MSRPSRPTAAPPGAPDAPGAPSPTHRQRVPSRHLLAPAGYVTTGRPSPPGFWARLPPRFPSANRHRSGSPRGRSLPGSQPAWPPFARSPLRPRSHRAGRPPVRKLQRIKLRDTGALVDTWTGGPGRERRPACTVSSERQRRPPARPAPASLQARHDPGPALSGCFLSPFAGGYLGGTVVATPTSILQSNHCLFLWRRGRTRLFIFHFLSKLLPSTCPAKQLGNRFEGAPPGQEISARAARGSPPLHRPSLRAVKTVAPPCNHQCAQNSVREPSWPSDAKNRSVQVLFLLLDGRDLPNNSEPPLSQLTRTPRCSPFSSRLSKRFVEAGRASIILIINRIRERLQRMKPIKEKACRRFRKSAKTRRVTQGKPSSGPVCRLCLQEPGDPEKLGEFLQKDNLSVHYFCLILSSKLPQRGQSNRGFHGFLPEDIKKEAARASRKICFVCKKKGAAINCQKDHCVRNFHLPCGQERGCLSQFFGEYKSFCEKHRPTQDIHRGNVGEESCVLCCEDLSQASVENIQSPCCSQTIYHRKCIQKYAHTSAKHFFKCPQCNNREEFPQEMLRMGIHIPDRDAAWELEPGAFSELYQRYQHCDAPICLYEQGRDNFEDEGRWSLVLCATCGSRGTHRDCSSLRSNSKKWECEECAPSPKVTDYISENSGDIPCCSTFYSGGA